MYSNFVAPIPIVQRKRCRFAKEEKMKASSISLLLLVGLVSFSSLTSAQQLSAFRVTEVAPYDKAVPGEIMQLLVEGIEGGASPLMLSAEDFKLIVSQDGVSQEAKIRTVTATLISNRHPGREVTATVAVEGMQMRAYQSVNFVVPRGLHMGVAELTPSQRRKPSNTSTLTNERKPKRSKGSSGGVRNNNTSSLTPAGIR